MKTRSILNKGEPMKITRQSSVTGVTRTLDLPVTEQQILEWKTGKLIQDAMPKLTDDQREFIKSGISPDEWEELFEEEE